MVSISLVPDRAHFTSAEPVEIQVTIENRGDAAVTRAFWVDLYINPRRAPQVNDVWQNLCGSVPCVGATWPVTTSIPPGGRITLSSVAVAPRYSAWSGRLPAGTSEIAVYVDSWNTVGTDGAVGESDETNNHAQRDGLIVERATP